MSSETDSWIDLYSMILDRMAETLADPGALYDKLGIREENKRIAQSGGFNTLPQKKLDLERYAELRASWKRVSADIRAFGITLNDDLEMESNIDDRNAGTEQKYVVIAREGDKTPLMFYGRDAYTVFGFMGFYANAKMTRDPRADIKRALEAQGITRENFHQHVGLAGIANPWAEDTAKDAS